jgi:predicted adenine nucleotide alpha hydrolase (AANH) superfamily ATPase
MKRKDTFQAPMGETTVLLHTCCAPCSSAIIEAMMQNGITPVIYYCNPNIYPQEEYEIRKEECTRYAQALGLEIIDADYDHENWLAQMKGLEDEPERGGRCLKCFKLRLLRTAEYARQRGIKVIATTLASSRWKSLDQINEAGTWACQQSASILAAVDIRRSSAGPLASAKCPENIAAATAPGSSLGEKPVCPNGAVDESRLGVDVFPVMTPVFWCHNWKKGGLQERRLQILKEFNFYNQQYCGCEFSMRKPLPSPLPE